MSDPSKPVFVSHFIPPDELDYWRWLCNHCSATSYELGAEGKYPSAWLALEAGEQHDCTHEWDDPDGQ